jgi:hypothetical protein
MILDTTCWRMEGLPPLEEGNYGPAAWMVPGDSQMVLYDDDSWEPDDPDAFEKAATDEELEKVSGFDVAVCLARDGNTMAELPHDSLRAVPWFDPDWICEPFAESHVYAILPVPLLDVSRVKIGITKDLRSRMTQFRTANPFALLIGLWPGGKVEEERAFKAVGGERLGDSEVFICYHLEDCMKRLHKELG